MLAGPTSTENPFDNPQIVGYPESVNDRRYFSCTPKTKPARRRQWKHPELQRMPLSFTAVAGFLIQGVQTMKREERDGQVTVRKRSLEHWRNESDDVALILGGTLSELKGVTEVKGPSLERIRRIMAWAEQTANRIGRRLEQMRVQQAN